ncbi:MAG: T9SS type A sorting domain-containing protein [Saprospiraceae bacterium]|nr:T9SS type A sorting domain-containing protein [Saprospiraceae bacterium]HMW38902.1 T9SS type A sorting domain-containing protein [Saprospiraceae bacterium]HMX88439.1 T9SS type A sorting domain-containing protein [Saprospiraceae bacterium]HMZ40380.1 T9SS type A sorting domain-containing protein [Saprospiraceae bacterium]HNB31171.1 T9SS type A sorting domain-containing protein [Saprospiraceae bacterium]
MKNRLLFLILLSNLLILNFGIGQGSCIQVSDTVCLNDCVPVQYIGNNSDNASYIWTISCGTITNPNSKNPHEACFLNSGNCTITLITQEPGAPPETCIVNVFVRPLPTARFVLRTDSVCLNNCLGLRIDFAGTPPYIFMIRDTTGVKTFRSAGNSTIVSICPTVSQTIALLGLEDAYCKNPGLQSFFRIKVFPPFKGNVYSQYSQLCASPPVISYRWFECNTNTLVSTVSCFAPPREDCYCAVLYNGFCYDTVCTQFKCQLDCGINFDRNAYIGDNIKLKYKGNGGPKTRKTWTYTLDNITYTNSNEDSLNLVFATPGCYVIRLDVEEEICKSSCIDTICVKSRPCECSVFNKNYVVKVGQSQNSCCYEIQGEINSSECFTGIKLLTNNGSLSNVSVNGRAGWKVVSMTQQSLELSHGSGHLPTGFFSAAGFCIANADKYTITVYYYYEKNGVKDSCKYQYVYTCSQSAPGCDSTQSYLELQHTSPPSCCYFLRTNNYKSGYFNRLTLTVNSGSINNIVPSSGFSIVSTNAQSITLSHISGFIPTGAITPVAFCLTGFTNPVTINVHYLRVIQNKTDSCNTGFRFYCPDDGTPKPDCCDSTQANLLAFGNVGCCWNLTAFSKKSACFSKICVTSANGNFINYVANSGWTVSPVNGGICFSPTGGNFPSGSVNPGHFCMNNFSSPISYNINFYDLSGNILTDCKKTLVRECKVPSPCSCDSLDNQIFQNSVNAGYCCHSFLGTIPYSNCYTKIAVTVNAGSFTNIIPAAGYNISGGGSSFIITHQSGHLPVGNITPATFCVNGATVYTITVQYIYMDQNGIEQRCVFFGQFDCPSVGPKCNCDSLSTIIQSVSVNTGNCCYKFTSNVAPSNCFTKITVTTSAGQLNNILPANGFNVSNNNGSGFTLTHNSGHIPAGQQTPASFCVSGAAVYVLTVTYYYLDVNGLEQKCIKMQTFDCPSNPKVCTCDSLKVLINQTSTSAGQCCHDITNTIGGNGCFLRLNISLSSGVLLNPQASPGFTLSNISSSGLTVQHTSGFIPSGTTTPLTFCVSGSTSYIITAQYIYKDQNGIEQRCVISKEFNCPPASSPCKCDSLKAFIQQTSNNPGLCCHKAVFDVPSSNCFIAVKFELDHGIFTNVNASPNFTIGNLASQSFNLGHTSGFLPAGQYSPVTFCVSGAVIYTITMKFLYTSNGVIDSCVFPNTFECKPLDSTQSCPGGACLGNRSWQAVGANNGIVYDLKNYQCALYAGGQFTLIGGQNASNIAIWNGSTWSPLPGGGLNGTVRCMEVHNGILYVGGQFTMAGTTAVNNIAAWNGTSWSAVGGGVTGINPSPVVFELLSTSGGLIVGGQFALTGNNLVVNNIAMWNGTIWTSPFANGIPYPVSMLREFNGDLYAGGAFFGNPYQCIARWNGTAWSSLTGGGINLVNNILYHGIEQSIIRNGEMIIGGHFKNAAGVPSTQHIARWNGNNWLAMPEGDLMDSFNSVNDFIYFNGELFAGGEYQSIGSTAAKGVARSVNNAWVSVSHPDVVTWALETYDSCGTKSCDLYAAGEGFVNRWVCVTSTRGVTQKDKWYIYPNPVDQYVIVKTDELNEFAIEVNDINGLPMRRMYFSGSNEVTIDLSDLADGMYFILIKDINGYHDIKKLIKQ